MAIGDDFEVGSDKSIKHISGTTCYTVLAFHRWLQDLADNAVASGNDYMDITVQTPSERAYDTIITLVNGFLIDDHAARFLYDGSIIQDGGDDIYDGIVVYAPAGTSLEIIQNGAPITPNFWGTALNADATKGISHRFILKVRTGGTDIDSRKLLGQTRVWGKQFSEFLVNGTSRGNNTIAVSAGSDLNNISTESDIEGYTTMYNVTQGYKLLDINNDTVNEKYYSEWDKGAYTINQLYERGKWLSAEPRTEDSNADTGTDFDLGNGTITAQGQSFTVGANEVWIARVTVDLKRIGAATGIATVGLYAHSGAYGSAGVPSGAALACSAGVDVTKISTSAYETVEFGFLVPAKTVASTYYAIGIHFTGDASNYLKIKGLSSSGTHSGNRSQFAGSWSAVAADDLNFTIKTTGNLYELPGNVFRGITHDVVITTPRTGTFGQCERVYWTGGVGQMLAIDSQATGTEMWIQLLTGTAPTNGLTITGTPSGATTTVNGTPTEYDVPEKGALPFIGASTGSAIIGGYGVGIQYGDLTSSDRLFDLTNNPRQPPNNVQFTVSGLVVDEDYILVGPKDTGNDFDFDQLTLNTSLSSDSETAVVVTTTIPSDTPNTGWVRIQLNSGKYRSVAYTSWATSTFTIASTDFTADPATAPKNVFIGYIDKIASSTSESFTGVYSTPRSLWIRIRDGGTAGDMEPTKTFETGGTFQPGGSAGNIRTPDL